MSQPITGYDAPSFITPTELRQGALAEVVNYAPSNSDDFLAQVCIEASQTVEETCERRLLPFVDLAESDVMTGVSADGLGLGDEPLLGMSAALGLSEARAYGAVNFCRDLWLSHFPPRRSELWTYDAITIALRWPWGGDPVLLNATQFDGPTLDTGHIRMRVGVLAPPGTEYTVTYSGGYTLGIPYPLKAATRWTAIRSLILQVEPEMRPGMSLTEVDDEITRHLAGYSKD